MDKSESLDSELECEGGEVGEERGACGGIQVQHSPPSGPDPHCSGDADANDTPAADDIDGTNRLEDVKMSSPWHSTNSETTLFTDQDEFLTAIHNPFLDLVSPIESGLVDRLRMVEALSSEDEQSIAGENGRRKRARKFWTMLHRISEEDFACSFVPRLRKVYPHLVSGMEFRLEGGTCLDKCLRHAMRKHISLKRLIDLLPSARCCSVEDYRRLSSLQYYGDREWEEVFCLLKTHALNPQLCMEVEEMLRKKKIGAPERFREVAAGGFICTCWSSQQAYSPDGCEESLETHFPGLNLDPERESSTTYPSSPFSEKISRMTDTASIVDSGVYEICEEDGAAWQMALSAVIQQQFQRKAEKNQYKVVESKINTAIARASNIRTDYRFLEKIRDDVRSLASQAEDETPTAATNQELQALLRQAQEFLSTISCFFQEVQATWAKVKGLDSCFSFTLPNQWRMYLMIRHHLLRNEVQECHHFVEKAHAVFGEVIAFCHPLPLEEEDSSS